MSVRSTWVSALLGLATYLALTQSAAEPTPRADLVWVQKSAAKLHLMHEGKAFATFHIALGFEPVGDKQQQGDGRTPEGRYVLDSRNPHSAFYKSLHVSYPNAQDRAQARRLGVSPGGDIMVHGQPNGWGEYAAVTQLRNWTLGCIALSNEDMDVVWASVVNGTPIQIDP